MSDGLTFTKEFEAEGRLRAMEIVLTALITSSPNPTGFQVALGQLMDREEGAYNQVARSLPGDSPASALQAVNGRFADIRDTVDRIIRGTPRRPTGP